MIKRIIKLLLLGIMFVALLSFGGYTVQSFKSEIHLNDPKTVLSPILNYLPSLPEGDTSNGKDPNEKDKINVPNVSEDTDITTSTTETVNNNTTEDPIVDENGNIKKQEIKKPSKVEISYARSIKVKIDDKEIELTSKNTISFIKWLNNNYKDNSNIETKVDKEETSENTTEVTKNTSTTETTTNEVKYNDVLESKADLNVLVNSIHIVDKLPEYADYDRTDYEKPVKSYKLNGNKVNRNDYAWKTSKWFNEKDFTYTCPYTGTILKDADDGKEDNDFSKLDYDHIVPLKSTYIRGAKDWTDEQKNEYAYNQWVGVDVLYSANRSKADKGPTEYLPDINIEDYCYSWLLICSYYNLDMTQEEINVCVDNINIALDNGESVEFLGGKMPK